MKYLRNDTVYKDIKWNNNLMFAYDKKNHYIAYIDGNLYLQTGTIEFKDAYDECNAGKTSRVGEHILERNTIREVNKINNKQKEKQMKDVNYIGGEYKIARVTYNLEEKNQSPTYNFKVDIDTKLEAETIVVVESSNGYGLAKVVDVLENCSTNAEEVRKATGWVVDVINTRTQDARRIATEERKYIIQQLDEKKAQMESISVYELLAKSDPAAQKLLDKLNTPFKTLA